MTAPNAHAIKPASIWTHARWECLTCGESDTWLARSLVPSSRCAEIMHRLASPGCNGVPIVSAEERTS